MRTIKFRGYNTKNNQWLYGYYFVNRGKHYIVKDEMVDLSCEASDFEVDPDSIGQLFAEANGVDLYEGDYVEYKRDVCHKDEPECFSYIYKMKCHIRYDEERAQILMFCINQKNSNYIPFNKSNLPEEEYKVVGNDYETKTR